MAMRLLQNLTGRHRGAGNIPAPAVRSNEADAAYRQAAARELLNEQKSINAAIVNAHVSDFADTILELSATDVFRYINHVVSKIIPIVEETGGEVDKIFEAGIDAIYSSDYPSALQGAISMCQTMSKARLGYYDFKEFAVGICYGFVMVGVVGVGKSYASLNVSEYMELSKYIQSIARKHYSKLLVTGSYVALLDNFDQRFNSRYLGKIYVNQMSAYEDLYDVYDADTLDTRNKKRKTKMNFENGVRLFIQKDYYEARLQFVETLKADRNDRAAKEYLLLCDKCINHEEGYEGRDCIVVW